MTLSALTTAAYVLFPLCMVYAAVSDLMTMRIPNWIPMLLALGFAALAPLAGMDIATVGIHVATGVAILAVAFGCFAMGWMGGGDAKLAAAIGLWFGLRHGIAFVAVSALFGGLLTFLMLGFRRFALPGFMLRLPWVFRLHQRDEGVPYGIALAAAALVIYPDTFWIALVR